MRFKAKVQDVGLFLRTSDRSSLSDPADLVQTIEKIEKSCTVLLSPKKVSFIIVSDLTNGFQVWSAMNAASLFEDFTIESKNNNEISFTVQLDHLLRGLLSGKVAHQMHIRLTKKNGNPYLNLSIEMMPTKSMTVTQEIPIQLLSAAQFQVMQEPQLPDPEVYILMPKLKDLKSVVEHLKNIDPILILEGNMAGQLIFKVENETVSVATYYRNLEHPQVEGKDTTTNPNQTAKVRVDIKKFSKFLFCHQISPQNVICCIVENTALVLHVVLDDLFLTYYIPVLNTDAD